MIIGEPIADQTPLHIKLTDQFGVRTTYILEPKTKR